MQAKQGYRRILRVTMIAVAVAGVASSLYFGQQRFQLQQELQRLAQQVGYLDVQDESRVHIVAMPVTEDIVPPGVEVAHIWRFRMYLPAGYSPSVMSRHRAVAADSPRSRGGGGWSTGSRRQEAAETEVVISLLKTENGWLLSRKNVGSSGASSLSNDLSFDSLDDLVVQPIVDVESGVKSFSVDEAVCILRVRGTAPSELRDGEPPLYPGFAVYCYDSIHQDTMDRWARGDIDRWPETFDQ